jgi:hypothetical protein
MSTDEWSWTGTDKDVLSLIDNVQRDTELLISQIAIWLGYILFSRFTASEGVQIVVASYLNILLKMNLCILYILCTVLHFLCFIFLPERLSHCTYRN